jgi:hypothetical protein
MLIEYGTLIREDNTMTMTTEEVDQYRSEYGGWDKDGLSRLGVQWPPVKGWRRRLLAGLDPNAESDDAVFCRLENGKWGIRVTCHSREIVPGMSITVRKIDNSTTVVKVGCVLRQGSHYAICTFFV